MTDLVAPLVATAGLLIARRLPPDRMRCGRICSAPSARASLWLGAV